MVDDFFLFTGIIAAFSFGCLPTGQAGVTVMYFLLSIQH